MPERPELPSEFQGKHILKAKWGREYRVNYCLVHNSLIGWWYGNRQVSFGITSSIQLYWGLHAHGHHTVSLFHLVGTSVSWASLVAQIVKRLPAVRETWVRSLGWEDPLEKEMATHSSTLAWKIPRTVEPCRLQSMGSQRVRHDWATSLHFTLVSVKYLVVQLLSYVCFCGLMDCCSPSFLSSTIS